MRIWQKGTTIISVVGVRQPICPWGGGCHYVTITHDAFDHIAQEPLVLTSGVHQSMYGWQAGGRHLTRMLSCFSTYPVWCCFFFIYSTVRSKINSVRNNLRNLFWKYLDELQLLDGDSYVQGNYTLERNGISNDISNAVNILDNVIEQVYKAPLFLDHMLDFQWLLNCQVNEIDHRNRGVLKI